VVTLFTEKDLVDKVREIAVVEPDTVYAYGPEQSACSYVPGQDGEAVQWVDENMGVPQ
jgi:hypothetical protein